MKKPYPVFCMDCRWSDKTVEKTNLCCFHPKVLSRDPWALGNGTSCGETCHVERAKGWFAACGMRGKLWVSRDDG
jgi:hypothetical protein